MQNKRLKSIAFTIILLLIVPLIAMQFTDEVNWDLTDFIVAGILLISFGLLIDFTMRKLNQSQYKLLIIFIIVILFLLIWAELAVGVFGTPLAGN